MIQEPETPTRNPRARAGSGRNAAIRTGLILTAVFMLAIPVVMAVTANTPSRFAEELLAAGASTAPGASAQPDQVNLDERKGDQGSRFGRGGFGTKQITIRAINGSRISLATKDGWTRTVVATGATAITKGGATIDVGDLKVGDEIHFKQTRNDDGSYTITTIIVPTPTARGEVTKVDGNLIAVRARDGATRVLTVTGSTAYTVGRATGSISDVRVGSHVYAQGVVSGDFFTATSVRIKPSRAAGEVIGTTSDSITVKNRKGTTTVIHVTDSTTYKARRQETASHSDIGVGDRVSATGILRADGSLDAVAVQVRPPKGQDPAKAPASSAAPG